MLWTLFLATEAASNGGVSLNLGENFDPANALLNFGLLGVFVFVLFKGGLIVLAREQKATETACDERIAVKDDLIAEKDRQIVQLRQERDEHRALVIERENFIRESVVKSNVDLMDRQMELIRIRMEGWNPRRKSDDGG